MEETVILYTTWPDAETAEAAAAEVVANRLAACANLWPGVRSIYRWQGAVETAAEVVMILKTTAAAAPLLRDALARSHPYDAPCIVAVKVDPSSSAAQYLDWIASTVPKCATKASNE